MQFYFNEIFPGCDLTHGPDHGQGSSRQQLLLGAGPLRPGHPAGVDQRQALQPRHAHHPQVGGGAEHDHQGLGGQMSAAAESTVTGEVRD